MKFAKIGSKYINIDRIAYIDIKKMTIYLNYYNSFIDIYFGDEFRFSEEFENTIIEVLNNI